MQVRTAFGGARISRNVIAVFAALLLLAFVVGGASGYLVKGTSVPVAAQNHALAPQSYALSDASTRSLRGGPQTVETTAPIATSVAAPSATRTRPRGWYDTGLQTVETQEPAATKVRAPDDWLYLP
jgi:hypothetical protein